MYIKKILFFLLILPLCTSTLSASGKPKCKLVSQLVFTQPIPSYTEEELMCMEKEHKTKIPKLARKIYSNTTNINEKRFISSENENIKILIDDIYPLTLEDLKKKFNPKPPTENVLLFGVQKDSSCGELYIDDDYIWYSDGFVMIPFSLYED